MKGTSVNKARHLHAGLTEVVNNAATRGVSRRFFIAGTSRRGEGASSFSESEINRDSWLTTVIKHTIGPDRRPNRGMDVFEYRGSLNN